MEDIAELSGVLINVFFALTIFDFALKFILRKFRVILIKYPKFYKFYLKLTKFFIQKHKWFGFATILFIILHFIGMFIEEGLSVTGLVAAGFMLAQVLLGAVLRYIKPKGKVILWIHRIIAMSVFVSILIHIA